jgi:hypothetical protein
MESPTIFWPGRATGRWPEFPERRWSKFSEPADGRSSNFENMSTITASLSRRRAKILLPDTTTMASGRWGPTSESVIPRVPGGKCVLPIDGCQQLNPPSHRPQQARIPLLRQWAPKRDGSLDSSFVKATNAAVLSICLLARVPSSRALCRRMFESAQYQDLSEPLIRRSTPASVARISSNGIGSDRYMSRIA